MPFDDEEFKEKLDDLTCRFVINVPVEECTDFERIGFQIEQAHWFYEDIMREDDPSLPTFSALKSFAKKMCQNCKLLERLVGEDGEFDRKFDEFMKYRLAIPVRGAIILNEALDKCVLVRGYHPKASWGFPRGKINQGEEDHMCAIREVEEETGYNIADRLDKNDYISYKGVQHPSRNNNTARTNNPSRNNNPPRNQNEPCRQDIRLYIITGVPENTEFNAKTVKEIGEIKWFRLDDLPKKPANGAPQKRDSRFFMIIPALRHLRANVEKKKKERKKQMAPMMAEYTRCNTYHQSQLGEPYGHLGESHYGYQTEDPYRTSANTRIPSTNDALVRLQQAVQAEQATQVLRSIMGVGQPQYAMQSTQSPDTSQSFVPSPSLSLSAGTVPAAPAGYALRYSHMSTAQPQTHPNGHGHHPLTGAEWAQSNQ